MKTLSVIVARRNDGIIGDRSTNSIPWKHSEDMKHFHRITDYIPSPSMYNLLIVGRLTYQSMPNLSGNRKFAILSKDNYNSIDEVVMKHLDDPDLYKIFVCGGSSVYQQTFSSPLLVEIYETIIDDHSDVDDPVTIEMPSIRGWRIEETTSKAVYRHWTRDSLFEIQYLQLVNKIWKFGEEFQGRNSVVRSIKGAEIKIDLRDGFPILTTREIYWKGIVCELLWMLSGSTDVSKLQKMGVKIWNGNSNREYLDSIGLIYHPEWEIGPGYGYQFRRGKDQWTSAIKTLKENPRDRRIIINLWDIDRLHLMALPPCHLLYQFSVTEDRLNCHLYQRSWDIMLGWNTSTAALMTHILASLTGYQVGTLIHTIHDAHIYQSHQEGVEEILKRIPKSLPTLKLPPKEKLDYYLSPEWDFRYDQDFVLEGYQPGSKIKMEMFS